MATKTGICLSAGVLLLSLSSPFALASNKDKVDASIKTQDSTEKAAAGSQDKIDRIADETDRMLAEYKLTLRQYETLKAYNDHVQKIVVSQEQELQSIADQMAEVDTTDQGVVPLMARMVDALDQFVKLDVPFLVEERTTRIETIKGLLDRADVTVSEKYRRIMEAFQIEMEYGRTIEAYGGPLQKNGKTLSVTYLRIGRLTLLYQTLDKKEAAVWNKDSRNWDVLPQEYAKSVSQGLQIARKQAAPDLLKLPVSAPEKS
ncbi:MAG: DUF3450 domain-containing protein [bacterium]